MSNHKMLKIGLDYHGVITQCPHEFASLASELIRRGHEIHIISGGPCLVVTQLLREMHFPYTHSFTILEHYEGEGKVEHLADGGFHVDDKLWDSAKANYCKAKRIDLHIDDSMVYLQYFRTPYCRFDGHTNSCSVGGRQCLDFSLPAPQIADEIEKLFIQ